MRLIGLAVVLAVSLALAPLAVEPQQRGTVPRIGIISALTREAQLPLADAFHEGLHNLGYVEGRNIAIEWQYTDGRAERFAEVAAELVRLKVDVIVAANNPAVAAALAATKVTPIVMVLGLDPVGLGFIASLARPGGTVTGFSSYLPELIGKRLQFLREVAPNASRVAVLWDPNLTGMQKLLSESQVVAQALGVQLQLFEVRTPNEFDGAFAGMTRHGARAVLSLGSSMHHVQRARIAELALKNRLPSVCNLREFADAGCLMSYAPSFSDLWRSSAVYVDRILKGAKPSDLPVQQPTKFEFVINLKTAKALGITIPQSLLLRADELIQ
jgi:putative ABC transport system substrate-binding protein